MLGALAGASLGARVQTSLPATNARFVTGGLLVVVGAVVIGQSL